MSAYGHLHDHIQTFTKYAAGLLGLDGGKRRGEEQAQTEGLLGGDVDGRKRAGRGH